MFLVKSSIMVEVGTKFCEQETNKPIDVLIFLCHNKSPFLPERTIKESPYRLSFLSILNIKAMVSLHKLGIFDTVIISSGLTSGPNYPSEAYATYEYLLKNHPEVVDKIKIIFEDKSIDTTSNICECMKITNEHSYKNVGILSTSEHARNASELAHNLGLPIKYIFSSEGIVMSTLSDKEKQEFKALFDLYRVYIGDTLLESARKILVRTVDPKAQIPNIINKIFRG